MLIVALLRRYLILSRQRFNASNFASDFIPPSRRPHVNLSVIFKTLMNVEKKKKRHSLKLGKRRKYGQRRFNAA